MEKANKNKFLLVFIVGSIFFYFHSFLSVIQKSQTSDEGVHLVAGYEYLKFKDFRWNPEHPPLAKEIAALPLLFFNLKIQHDTEEYQKVEQWGYSEKFLYFYNNNKFPNFLIYSRGIMIFFGILLGFFLFLFIKELYDFKIGLIPLLLFFFDPNFLGHSPLITTDVPSTAFAVGSIYFLWKFLKNERILYIFFSGLFFGLAQSTKHSIFIIVPIIILIIFIILIFRSKLTDIIYEQSIRNKILYIIIFIVLIIIFNKKTILGITNYYLKTGSIILLLLLIFSEKFKNIIFFQRFFRFAYAFLFLVVFIIGIGLLITPIFYLDYRNSIFKGNIFMSFNNIKYIIDHAYSGHGWIFLNGKFYEKGNYFYYLYVFLIKTPISTLFLIFLGILSTFIMKKKEHIIFFILPPALYMILISILNKSQIGIRHEFFIYPFLFLISGNFFELIDLKNKKIVKISSAFFLICILISCYKNFPNFISYTNGLLFSPQDAYLYISDSNIDWGQEIPSLIKFLKRIDNNTKVYVKMHYEGLLKNYGYKNYTKIEDKEINENLNGILVVDVQEYNSSPDKFVWLKKNKKPDFIINNAILIFILNNE